MIPQSFNSKCFVYLFFFLLSFGLSAQIPSGYYKSAEGKNMAELKTALYAIIKQHTVLEYYSSSKSFETTDWHPATTDDPGGYFWDMYSNNHRTIWTGMNREHNFPKSWWSSAPETTIAYTDLHNLYPSDVTANLAKENFPLGEVIGIPTSPSNGVTKVGKGSYPNYNGGVFEPADEYKGDFARNYMYVVTCYEDYAPYWRSTGTQTMLLGGSTYPVFTSFAIKLLLEWSRQDPVSQKEITRNTAVYNLQHNRNPFIDYPELSEFIWGKYMGDKWVAGAYLPEDELGFRLKQSVVLDSLLATNVYHPELSNYFV